MQAPDPVLDKHGELNQRGPGTGPAGQFLDTLASTGIFASSIRSTG
jgi:hypothetical protein